MWSWPLTWWELCLYVGMLKSVAVSIVGARLGYIESRNSLSVLTPEPSSIFSCPFKRSCELLRPVRIGVLQRSASGPPSSELTEINRYCGHLPARLTWPYRAMRRHTVMQVFTKNATQATLATFTRTCCLSCPWNAEICDSIKLQRRLLVTKATVKSCLRQWRYRGFSTQRYHQPPTKTLFR